MGRPDDDIRLTRLYKLCEEQVSRLAPWLGKLLRRYTLQSFQD